MATSIGELVEDIDGVLNETYPSEEITVLKRYIRSTSTSPSNGTPTRPIAKGLAVMFADSEYMFFCNGGLVLGPDAKWRPPVDIDASRGRVRSEFIATADAGLKRKNGVKSLSPHDLGRLFKLYDREWFNGRIQTLLKQGGHTVAFEVDGDSGFKTIGVCAEACDYTITIPTKLFATARNGTIVAGVRCVDPLDCVMRVVEHELVHLLVFTFCESHFVTNQHSRLFMSLANKLFGHVEYSHRLNE